MASFSHQDDSNVHDSATKTSLPGTPDAQCVSAAKSNLYPPSPSPVRTPSANAHEVKRVIVMGPTGSGKSTLINHISSSMLPVSHSLASCTREYAISSQFRFRNDCVELIDTPGFNDSVRSDMDILEEIAKVLKDLQNNGKRLHGIIYLHNISEWRMTGSALRCFRTFRELCGPEAMKNVAIVTNQWDAVPESLGDSRTAELEGHDQLFLPALNDRARLFRNDKANSMDEVLEFLMDRAPVQLRIQTEMASGCPLLRTTAGASINREMAQKIAEHEAKLLKLNEEFAMARQKLDRDAQEEIEDERESTRKNLEELLAKHRAPAQRRWDPSDVRRAFRSVMNKYISPAYYRAKNYVKDLPLAQSSEDQAQAESEGGTIVKRASTGSGDIQRSGRNPYNGALNGLGFSGSAEVISPSPERLLAVKPSDQPKDDRSQGEFVNVVIGSQGSDEPEKEPAAVFIA